MAGEEIALKIHADRVNVNLSGQTECLQVWTCENLIRPFKLMHCIFLPIFSSGDISTHFHGKVSPDAKTTSCHEYSLGKCRWWYPTLFHTWLRFLIVYTPMQYNSQVYTSKRRVMSIIILKQIMYLFFLKALIFCKHLKCLWKLHSPGCSCELHVCFNSCMKAPPGGSPAGTSAHRDSQPGWEPAGPLRTNPFAWDSEHPPQDRQCGFL